MPRHVGTHTRFGDGTSIKVAGLSPLCARKAQPAYRVEMIESRQHSN